MQSNVPVTPQMAELGAAIVVAVQAVLDNPKAAGAAAEAYAKAVELTAEEVLAAQEARQLIVQAESIAEDFGKREQELNDLDHKLKIKEADLNGKIAAHTENVDSLNDAAERHNGKLEQLETRESKLEEAEENMASDLKRLEADKQRVTERERAVQKREQDAAEFAKKIGGAAA